MKASILRNEILPFAGMFGSLLVAAVVTDALLRICSGSDNQRCGNLR